MSQIKNIAKYSPDAISLVISTFDLQEQQNLKNTLEKIQNALNLVTKNKPETSKNDVSLNF